jgi:peptidoglycan/LPS O-acetylase OafA/YrhL
MQASATVATTERVQDFRNGFHIEAGLSQFLDFARWISATIVLLVHVNNRVTVRLGGTIDGATLPQIAWGFICGFGHHAVVVFFVLSGFLIGSKVVRDIAEDRFDTRRYLIARVSRIHLVLIPALLLTLVLDAIGSRFDGAIYAISQPGSFVGNVFMLQGFTTEPFGSDAPLGTLANEFWYYMIFPLLAVGVWKRRPAFVALPAAIMVAMTMIQPWHGVGFVLWLIGALAGSIAPREVSKRAQISVAILFIVLLVAFRLGIRLEQYTAAVVAVTDITVASAFALVIFCLRRNPFFDLGAFTNANTQFAGFSYSLYAVHAPIVMLLCAVAVSLTGFGWKSPVTQPWHWAIVASMVAIPLLGAYLFSRATEAKTDVVRAWLNASGIRLVQTWRSGGPAAQG